MKRFNITGLCVPAEDFMVDISGKIEKITEMIDSKMYFTINRGRQYGKTTTLSQLRKTLRNRYVVVSISFERLDYQSFESSAAFCASFLKLVRRALDLTDEPIEYKDSWLDDTVSTFDLLNCHIAKMCRNKEIVLMIDEVDKTSNNRIFLHFLSMLRDKYLARKDGTDYTFRSVILAGVYNIKNIKLKMINEGNYTPSPDENKIYNSPWNIAADFKVDMSFSPAEIAGMLRDYENDRQITMDTAQVAEEIHAFTNGYPFLVSKICKLIDEELDANWSAAGVREAVNLLTDERNTLFDDIYKNLENNKKLYDLIYDIVILGISYTFNLGNPEIELGAMYCILDKRGAKVAVANTVFEIIVSEYFVSKNETANHGNKIRGVLREDVVTDGKFDMELCLKKFAEHYAGIYSKNDLEFLEKHGRLLFLTYIKPLINGDGFYHIESETRNQRRMDLVVTFGTDEFILELKIWRGEAYKTSAYTQLLDYMDAKNKNEGYLLTFDFRENANKETKAEWTEADGKRVFDIVV